MLKNVESFIRKYALTRKKLSFQYLKYIFESLGYEIVFFNQIDNQAEVQTLIDTYRLHKYIVLYKSFIFENDIVKLLFLRAHIGEDELIHYMLHEIGHIWLNHNYNTYCKEKQEREADEFAVLVKILLKYKRFLYAPAIIIVGLLLTIIVLYTQQGTKYISEPVIMITPSPVRNNISVVVTMSGEKYHLPDCQYVRNNNNTTNMSKEKALSDGYEPCAVCRPDK